ncbi:hypothetical protein PMAYCL1PPCAC_26170, partial [Pristionchus mayeri]
AVVRTNMFLYILILASFAPAGSVDLYFKNNCNSPITVRSIQINTFGLGLRVKLQLFSTGVLTEFQASYQLTPQKFRNGMYGKTLIEFHFNTGLGHEYAISVMNGFDVGMQIKPTANTDCCRTLFNPNGDSMKGRFLLGGHFNATFCPP